MKFLLPITTALCIACTASLSQAAKPGKGEAKAKPAPEEVFKQLDKDADGSLTLEEFKASPRGKKDPAKAEEMFKKLDKDSNSKLSLEEFKAHGPKADKKGAPEAPKEAPKDAAKEAPKDAAK